jgi:hypothetical protein
VTADGRRLAYLHDDGRVTPRLRIVELPSWRVLRSHRVTGQVAYDWLGDTLVIAQLEFSGRWRLRSDLWRWTPDGAWRRSTHDARLTEPRTGARVVSALRLQPGDNAPALPGVPDPPGAAWGAVVPSPDGRWVAATRHVNGRWALVRWPAAAPESVAVLAEPSGIVSDPLWMGEGVLYVAEVAGFPQVHLWTADGAAQVTDEPLGARAPAALPGDTLLYATLAGGGWELRAAPLTRRPLSAVPAVGARAAFDSAPPVTVRETGYRAWPSLRPHFWLPIGSDAGPSGGFTGAATAGGDAVGRYLYLASALASVRPARAQGAVLLLLRGPGNPTLDLSASNDWSHLGTVGGHVVSVHDLDAALGATFVARRWRRFVSLRLAAEYEGSRFVARPDTAMAALCTGCRRRDLVGGSVGLAAGSLTTAPLAVSPLDGAFANVLYRRRAEQSTARWSAEARGRLALYARLGPRVGFAHPVLAVRVAAGTIDGPIGSRFSVGGVSSGFVDLGFGQTVGNTRTFPVRGYDGGTLRGTRAATVTLEYRLPLALVGKAIGHLPLGVDRFSLALFGDAGDAWDAGQRPRLRRLRSAGAELVSDVRVSYDFPLRLRLGVAQPATGRTRVYGAFSADF